MNVEECKTALTACLPPEIAQAAGFDEMAIAGGFLDRLKDMIKKFIDDYVNLPDKVTFLAAVEGLVDSLLVSLPVGLFAKKFIKRAVMMLAEALYDSAVKYRVA